MTEIRAERARSAIPALRARAATAISDAKQIRADALTACWQASGGVQNARDLRLELAWSIYQGLRARAGEAQSRGRLRRCSHKPCAVHDGRGSFGAEEQAGS